MVRVWDPAIRLFHWFLAFLVVFSFITGKVRGDWLEWHMRSGYAILALLMFRLAWGVVGSDTARFAGFLRGPVTALAYVKARHARRNPHTVGHNPLGGWMVVLMLLILLAQAASGLFTDDEIATTGPLALKVSNAVNAKMHAFHYYNGWTICVAVALHVVAIATYQWGFRVNLIGPMVHGQALVEGSAVPRMASGVLAAVLFAISCAAVYWLVYVYPKVPS